MKPHVPKVSVIIPIKNGMPWLTATLDSLEQQTFKDFEVLVWDNGSTDGSLEVLQQWIPGRLTGQIISGDPLPYDKSLARLVEVAGCNYVARLDADDVATSQRLEKQYQYLELHSDTVGVGGQMEFVDEHDVVIGRADFLPCSYDGILSTLLFRCPLPHPGVMLRKDAVLQAGNYREFQPVEDLDLWLRLARVGKLVNLPDLVLKYRIRSGSVTASAKKAGFHLERIFECLRSGVPALFHINPQTYGRLLEKKHPLAVVPLIALARSIAGLSGVTTAHVLRSPEFLYSARCLTRGNDFFSKLAYFYFSRNKSASLFKQAMIKASFQPGIRSAVAWWRLRQQKRRMKKWLNVQRRRGCAIESLEIRGRENWEDLIEIGIRVAIEREVTVAFAPDEKSGPRLRVGPGVFIGRNTFISVFDGIEIGADTLIGAYSYVASNNHAFGTRAMAIKDQGYTRGPVKIGQGAWLGTHVVVLPNVTIGEGAIIGAGSVVTKSVGAYEIWGGVPARKIGDRP